MIKIITALFFALLLSACGSKEQVAQDITPKIVVGENLSGLTLPDQFEKKHTLKATTDKIVFAFGKEPAHICNDFFVTRDASYLADHNTEFIADVSAAPSLIRSMFILPGLKDFKHTVLLLNDKEVAAPFKQGMNIDKIAVVYLSNGSITKVTTLTTDKELQALIEAK